MSVLAARRASAAPGAAFTLCSSDVILGGEVAHRSLRWRERLVLAAARPSRGASTRLSSCVTGVGLRDVRDLARAWPWPGVVHVALDLPQLGVVLRQPLLLVGVGREEGEHGDHGRGHGPRRCDDQPAPQALQLRPEWPGGTSLGSRPPWRAARRCAGGPGGAAAARQRAARGSGRGRRRAAAARAAERPRARLPARPSLPVARRVEPGEADSDRGLRRSGHGRRLRAVPAREGAAGAESPVPSCLGRRSTVGWRVGSGRFALLAKPRRPRSGPAIRQPPGTAPRPRGSSGWPRG